MRLRFRETMSGWVQSPEGRKQFSFTVEAFSPKARAVAGWAPMTLRGTASLEGVVQEAELLTGSSLWVGLPFHRSLRYHIAFRDEKGTIWRFQGSKRVHLSHPLRTMTTLKGTLYRNGVEYGNAQLRFPLATLPAFVRSWCLEHRRAC